MRKSIIAAAILVGTTLAASAGTELQLQFKRWAYEGNGAVTLMVAMRIPTAKPFATVVWSCDSRITASSVTRPSSSTSCRGAPSSSTLNLGNDNPMARAYFSFEQPIQGRAEAVSKEEEDELEHKRGLVAKCETGLDPLWRDIQSRD